MKTHTTKKAIWARSLLLLPLFAGLIYSCSNTEELEMENNSHELATPEMVNEYNSIARKYNSQEDPMVEVADYQKMRQIYDRMSPKQKKAAESLPEIEIIEVVEDNDNIIEVVEDNDSIIEVIEVVEDKETATSAMIAEYNELAKMYRSRGVTAASVEEEDFRRVLYIHSIMTPEQRKTAEELPPPPPPTMVVPAPPPPPSPTEAINAWKAEGAEFYFEGKNISAQEALNLVEDGTKLSVKVEETGGTQKVRLSRDQD